MPKKYSPFHVVYDQEVVSIFILKENLPNLGHLFQLSANRENWKYLIDKERVWAARTPIIFKN